MSFIIKVIKPIRLQVLLPLIDLHIDKYEQNNKKCLIQVTSVSLVIFINYKGMR